MFHNKVDFVKTVLSAPHVITDILPAFCRVELKITTNATANSTATAEVWLPEEWNNRFLAVGNGGFSGGGKISIFHQGD